MKKISPKICIIGDKSVGKSSLVRNLLGLPFQPVKSDVDIQIYQKIENNLSLTFWDIHGGEKFLSLEKNYLSGSKLCILVADLSVRETILNLIQYKEIFLKYNPNTPVIIIFNKKDLVDTVVNWDEEDTCFYVSLKKNLGLENLMKTILQKVKK